MPSPLDLSYSLPSTTLETQSPLVGVPALLCKGRQLQNIVISLSIDSFPVMLLPKNLIFGLCLCGPKGFIPVNTSILVGVSWSLNRFCTLISHLKLYAILDKYFLFYCASHIIIFLEAMTYLHPAPLKTVAKQLYSMCCISMVSQLSSCDTLWWNVLGVNNIDNLMCFCHQEIIVFC